jgi:hypothetical protein
VRGYGLALLLTLIVEVPLYGVLLRYAFQCKFAAGMLLGAGVNIVSHPIGFLVIGPPLVGAVGATWTVALLELWAWFSESVLLGLRFRQSPATAGLISLIANGSSFSLGVLLLRTH